MNIDFKSFDYEIVGQNQYAPVVVIQPELVQGIENIRYEFSFREDQRGFYLTAGSEIYIPGQAGNFLLFTGDITFLIPYEQQDKHGNNGIIEIDSAVRAEFLHYHLARQSAIIFAETHNRLGDSYNINVPTIFELYTTDQA